MSGRAPCNAVFTGICGFLWALICPSFLGILHLWAIVGNSESFNGVLFGVNGVFTALSRFHRTCDLRQNRRIYDSARFLYVFWDMCFCSQRKQYVPFWGAHVLLLRSIKYVLFFHNNTFLLFPIGNVRTSQAFQLFVSSKYSNNRRAPEESLRLD